jgi:hypothetical protein
VERREARRRRLSLRPGAIQVGGLLEQHLAEADDMVHRGAQLVADGLEGRLGERLVRRGR